MHVRDQLRCASANPKDAILYEQKAKPANERRGPDWEILPFWSAHFGNHVLAAFNQSPPPADSTSH